jgi:hypothetical protein
VEEPALSLVVFFPPRASKQIDLGRIEKHRADAYKYHSIVRIYIYIYIYIHRWSCVLLYPSLCRRPRCADVLNLHHTTLELSSVASSVSSSALAGFSAGLKTKPGCPTMRQYTDATTTLCVGQQEALLAR